MTWQARRGSPTERVEGLDELAQSLALLLETPRGSRPHEPEFGSELWRLLDEPITTVRALAPAEVVRAAAYDQRLIVTQTVVEPGAELGGFVLLVHWHPAGAIADRTTRVEFA